MISFKAVINHMENTFGTKAKSNVLMVSTIQYKKEHMTNDLENDFESLWQCDTTGVCVCVGTYLVIVLTVNWEGGCVSCISSCR